ncbi:MAG: carbonic anhydrase [Gemmatimonadales bacterium]|nr:carbonic anhydrase [Gemmatimonadales bacterium]
MISAVEALELLREGNRRFLSDHSASPNAHSLQAHRAELVTGQEPFAIIVGCSDSRVPAEIIFDQGLGDLFIVRVAGNIVAPTQVGSIELAAEEFGTLLVVVLGHSGCGAVQATLAELENPEENLSPNLRSIIDRIRPSAEALLESDPQMNQKALAQHTVKANIHASVNQLRQESPTLARLIHDRGLMILGAEYSLETGVVEFFDDLAGGR